MLLCALGLGVAGCDTGAAPPAQGTGAAQPAAGLVRTHAGDPLPGVVLTDPAGRQLDLSHLEGRPVLVNLWATWCAPCVEEMPQLDRLAAHFADRLAVVAASQDVRGADVVGPFFARTGLRHLDPWLDPSNRLTESLGAEALPLTVLYDAEGREVWRLTGPFDWSSADAFAMVEEGLDTAPPGR
ncbi:TlpA family protein disulfide reductase [Erythrobacteraceae bacterium CFH 75059]|nr:TlpA family protein disulfide reductase [Erythrobacteraceae bacterium CFH 75059]